MSFPQIRKSQFSQGKVETSFWIWCSTFNELQCWCWFYFIHTNTILLFNFYVASAAPKSAPPGAGRERHGSSDSSNVFASSGEKLLSPTPSAGEPRTSGMYEWIMQNISFSILSEKLRHIAFHQHFGSDIT